MMIQKTPKEAELIEKIDPAVVSLGFELRDVTVSSGQPALVRVTIDRPNRDRGITLDDCYEVHRILDPLFDVIDPFDRAYTLEVSSPGEKAPLRLKKHFEEAVGGEIEFKTREAVKMEKNPTAAPRKNWRGKLLKVEEPSQDKGTIEIEDNLGVHKVDAKLIEGARWLRNWSA